jgi:uncharacterized protein YdeI (YjbR/CyaY-like superfamily)
MWCRVMIGHSFIDWILLLFTKSELFFNVQCPLDCGTEQEHRIDQINFEAKRRLPYLKTRFVPRNEHFSTLV